MPAWIHDRAKRIQEENPKMPESEAWAIATQQSHATGHTPKGYGTATGKRAAKRKYDGPKNSYQKTASVQIAAFLDELEKIGANAALAMEGLGVPGAMYAGYKEHGLRGLKTTGLGALGGLGIGALGSHMVSKMTANSPFFNRHPIAKAIADSTPIGLGGVVGGAVGEHFAGHGHKVAGVAGAILKKVSKSPIVALDALNDVGSIPARYRRYEEALEQGQPAGMVPLNMLPAR